MNKKLAREIYKASYITGEFVLRSGQVSNEYFDKYLFESDPAILAQVAEELSTKLPEGIDIIAGLEMGGIPVCTAISLHSGRHTLFVRKKAKEYEHISQQKHQTGYSGYYRSRWEIPH